ncbi:sigma-70 family RNA polymerase sigma factor [Oscillospiraceae bacterium 42-9]
MLSKGSRRRKRRPVCDVLFAVVHILWITAFFVSTEKDIFQQCQPVLLEYGYMGVPAFLWVRLFISLCDTGKGNVPGCRSPPSDFDFATTKKSKLEELPMKKINLRDYYPFYTKDNIVEVPDEVADLLREYKLSEAAYFLRTYRHKAYFSLDYDKNVERDALVVVLAPEDILIQEEEHGRLYRAITLLPEKQRNRICSHYLLGMSLSEIAKSEHSAVSSVHEGIQRGLRRLKKILEEI